jgi:hypothetical protein
MNGWGMSELIKKQLRDLAIENSFPKTIYFYADKETHGYLTYESLQSNNGYVKAVYRLNLL